MPKSYGPHSKLIRAADLDGRTRAGKEYRDTHNSLAAIFGGVSKLKPHQRLLIQRIAEKSVRAKLIWERMNEQEGDTAHENERRYIWYCNSLRRDLRALGLTEECFQKRLSKNKAPSHGTTLRDVLQRDSKQKSEVFTG